MNASDLDRISDLDYPSLRGRRDAPFQQKQNWSWLPWKKKEHAQEKEYLQKDAGTITTWWNRERKPLLSVDASLTVGMNPNDVSASVIQTMRAGRIGKLTSGVSLSSGDGLNPPFDVAAWTVLTLFGSIQYAVSTAGPAVISMRTVLPVTFPPKSLLRLRLSRRTKPRDWNPSDPTFQTARGHRGPVRRHIGEPGDFVNVELRSPPGFFAGLPSGRFGIVAKSKVTSRIKVKIRAAPRITLLPLQSYRRYPTQMTAVQSNWTMRNDQPVKGSLLTWNLPAIHRRLVVLAGATVRVKFRWVDIG